MTYIRMVSTTDTGTQVTDTTFYTKADISADGSYVAFLTNTLTLEPGIPAQPFGVMTGYWFIKNMQTGELARVQGENFFPPGQPSIFESGYDLVMNRDFGMVTYGRFAFKFDLDTGALLQTWEMPKDPSSSFSPHARVMGGANVAFGDVRSFSLTTGTTNERFADISVLDTRAGTFETLHMPLNVFADKTDGETRMTFNESATPVAASTSGRFVGIELRVIGIKIAPGSQSGGPVAQDFALYDRVTGVFTRLTNTAPAAVAAFTAASPSIDFTGTAPISYDLSDNGRLMLISTGVALNPDDTNGKGDVYLADGTTGLITRLSVGALGQQLTGDSLGGAISGDGRFVVFYSDATELGAAGRFLSDAYVLDRRTGDLELINTTYDGSDGAVSRRALEISADGRFISFFSDMTKFVRGDANGREDTFVAVNPFLADKVPTPGADTLNGDAGRDVINGLAGHDRVNGLAGNDVLAGGFGNDSLGGARGDDVLDGGAGRDLLQGGEGTDRFVFASGAQAGVSLATADTIADFRAVQGDKIDLHRIDAKPGTVVDDAFTFIPGGFTGQAGQLRYDAASHSLQGDLTGDGTADFFILVGAVGAGGLIL